MLLLIHWLPPQLLVLGGNVEAYVVAGHFSSSPDNFLSFLAKYPHCDLRSIFFNLLLAVNFLLWHFSVQTFTSQGISVWQDSCCGGFSWTVSTTYKLVHALSMGLWQGSFLRSLFLLICCGSPLSIRPRCHCMGAIAHHPSFFFQYFVKLTYS